MDTKYAPLLEPITVGGIELRNRFVVLPMTTEMVENFYITDPIIDFYEHRAAGGAGLVEVGSAYVCDCFDTKPLYCTTTGATGIWEDSFIPGWKKLADACHKHGAKVAAQLQCCYEWRASHDDPLEPVGPSEGPGGPFVKHLREMTVNEIHTMIKQYGQAARRAKEAGADIIEVHAGIGYMIMRFLSSYSNHRDDEYGGTLEKRCRLLNDVLDEICSTCGPDMPVIVRISADDLMPGGNRIEDTLKMIPLIEPHGVDCWNIQAGFHEAPRPVANQFVPEGEFNYLAKAVKTVTDKPVYPGTRINTLDTCLEVVTQGYGDMVGMARHFIADPDIPKKVAAGHPEQVRPCIVCSRCLDRTFLGKRIWCSVNGNIYNIEMGHPEDHPAQTKKNIIIVGAGPAGMNTARIATIRGHHCTIIEHGDKLGGVMNLAQVLNPNLEPLADWFAQEMERLDIDVRLNTEATPDLVASLNPDEVVVAPGGNVIDLDVLGVDGENVVSSNDIKALVAGKVPEGKGFMWKAAVQSIKMQGGSVSFMRMGLRMHALVGRRLVIVGGGFAGLECAGAMAEDREVTVVEEAAKLGNGIGIIDRKPEINELKKKGIKLMPSTKVLEINRKGVRVENTETGEDSFLECDTVLLSLGVEGNTAVYDEIAQAFPNAQLIGDATTPDGEVHRTLEAINAGYKLGMEF